MKKILVITFFFPPTAIRGNIAATMRLGKFVKYLPDFGWEPTVLSANIKGVPELPIEHYGKIVRTDYFNLRDTLKRFSGQSEESSVIGQLNDSEGVSIKSRFLSMGLYFYSNYVAFPDEYIGWYSHALDEGKKLIASGQYDAIFSSSGPETCHLVASSLQRISGLPWVADLRDLWAQNHSRQRPWFMKKVENILQKKTLANAHAITTVSKPLAEILEESFPDKKTYVIPNGYDEDDYAFNVEQNKKFNIVYTGQLYGEENPEPFIKAIKILDDKKVINPETFQVEFYGHFHQKVDSLAKRYGVSGYIHSRGHKQINDIIRIQKEANVLLLIGWNGEQGRGVYTGKVFEYLGAQRPILAITESNTSIAELINYCSAGKVCTTTTDIVNILTKWHNDFISNGKLNFMSNDNRIQEFSRRNLTKKLTEILSELKR